MKHTIASAGLIILALLGGADSYSQQPGVNHSASTGVPRIVRYTGDLSNSLDGSSAELLGITFAIYGEESDGAALWREVQNIHVDRDGKYTVQLGDATSGGLPPDLFNTGESRWLGVQVNGEAELPRVLFLSIPYALAAADARTLGGLPPSAFVQVANSGASSLGLAPASSLSPAAAKAVTTSGGTVNKIAKFDGTTDISNSQIVDTGTNVGIGSTAPAAKLDVDGPSIFRGPLSLMSTAAATASAGVSSPAFNLAASAFNSSTKAAQNQAFAWRVDPVGNNSTTPSGKLNLLFNSVNTGFSISNKGLVTFAPGQTFPGVVHGVESIALSAPSSDFTVGGGVFGSGTLSFNWITPPTSNNVPGAIVKRDGSGNFNVHTIEAVDIQAKRVTASGSSLGAMVTGYNQLPNLDDVGYGVAGLNSSAGGAGVVGTAMGGGIGVQGIATGTSANSGQGVWGESNGTQFGANGYGPDGVDGITHSSLGSGVAALNTAAGGDGLYAAAAAPGYAGYFSGNVHVSGNLSKAGGSFKIDHPLDPANKYLSHSFVESPDMMNIYNGDATTDSQGNAVIQLPDYFEALNRDFRYQLAVIGQFAEAIVTGQVAHNQFTIKTDKPNVEVSWQVTGVRHDAWANAHRIPVEEEKPEIERGHYLHPELFGAREEDSMETVQHPGVVKMQKAARAGQATMVLPPLPGIKTATKPTTR